MRSKTEAPSSKDALQRQLVSTPTAFEDDAHLIGEPTPEGCEPPRAVRLVAIAFVTPLPAPAPPAGVASQAPVGRRLWDKVVAGSGEQRAARSNNSVPRGRSAKQKNVCVPYSV